MASTTVFVTFLALLCVSATFAAPAVQTAESEQNKASTACTHVVSDIQAKIKDLITDDITLATLMPSIDLGILKCIAENSSNLSSLQSCISTDISNAMSKITTDVPQLVQTAEALVKEALTLPQKCISTGSGTSA